MAAMGLNAQQTYRFSLEDCLKYAMGSNLTRQSMKLAEESREVSYEQSKKERLPSLSASLSESFSSNKTDNASWNGTYGLSAGVPLYQGGNISNTIEQNKLTMEQSSYQTMQYDNDLTIRILQAFLTTLGNQELLNYQEAVVIASEEQLKQGKEQFQVGKILESDYLMLEAQFANDKNNISDTRIALDNNLISLKNLLSMSPTEKLEIIHPNTDSLDNISILPPMDHVLSTASSTLPEMKISQYNVDIADVNLKMSKAGYLPTINLNGSVGTGHVNNYSNFGTQLSDRINGQVGISVNIPIFDNNRTKSKVRQSQIALQQAKLNQEQNELDIIQNISTEYQNVVSALNKYQTTNIRQNAYLKTYEAYQAQFHAGSITAVDLLQQQNNYISALTDFIQSKYGFILKRKILDVYMGNSITLNN